jgi:phosphonate transport system permease protein
VAVLVALPVLALAFGDLDLTGLFAERRLANLERFVTVDLVPRSLRGEATVGGYLAWAGDVWSERGAAATLATFQLAAAAMTLAAAFALVAGALGTRTLSAADPYLAPGRGPVGRVAAGAARALFVAMRAIPEYVWAFLLAGFLFDTPWPAVAALAIHNGGILGRLFGDAFENTPVRAPRGLAGLGAGRVHLWAHALLPDAFPRLLAYSFYRFETCVREATALGMLGVFSIGLLVEEARSRQDHAEMLLVLLFGGGIVLLADLASRLARRFARLT